MDKRPLEGQVEEPPTKTKKELLAIEREKIRLEREAEKQARKALLEQQKQEREAARLLEKQQREVAKLQKQKEREEAKEAKEREKEAAREAREREKEAAREAREREKEAAKEAKEREKIAAKEAKEREKLAQQPRLGNFFSIVKKSGPASQEAEKQSDYEATFLSYHLKANFRLAHPEPPKESPDDCLNWLKYQPQARSGPYISAHEFKTGLNLGHDPQQLLEKVKLRHIQLFETVRPAFVGTVSDIEPSKLEDLCLNPTATALPLEYEYDSDLEWAPGDEDDEDLMDDDQSDEDGDAPSDMESFVASDDDEDGSRRRRAVGATEPLVKWNDGNDPEFKPFAVRIFGSIPIKIAPYHQIVVAAPVPTTELPKEAIIAILKGVQGHTGTKTFLLETLWHDLHTKYSILTRSGLKSIVDTHAKREKTGWKVLAEKTYLLETEKGEERTGLDA